MTFIDTHTHLFIEQNAGDGNLAVKAAIEAGVDKLLLPNIDLASINEMMQLTAAFPDHCFPMMGLHPCSVQEDWQNVLGEMRALFESNSFVAVGEIGLDLYWDKTTLEIQKLALKEQISWAKELNLPIVLHVRDAFDELFEVMDEVNDENLTGVFHCFTGSLEQAQKVMDYGGFYMGIGGVLTFKNSGVDQVVKDIPMDYLILETDSPYLAPVPFRGKPNTSKYIPIIAEKLADVKEISLAEVAEITTKNAENLFFKH